MCNGHLNEVFTNANRARSKCESTTSNCYKSVAIPTHVTQTVKSHFDQFPNPKHTTNKELKEKSRSRMYIATSIVDSDAQLVRNMK